MDHSPQPKHTAQLVITWSVVLVPLLYGLYNAVAAAAKLFSG
ncbi:hypothetical protein [Tsukamurella sp. 1534]|nr:hypothetical protein [Tsukamurella sp. 1534]